MGSTKQVLFSLLKAKRVRECIKILELEGGEIVTNEEKILKETQRHIQNLFIADQTVEDNAIGRAKILKLIIEKVMVEDNCWLKIAG